MMFCRFSFFVLILSATTLYGQSFSREFNNCLPPVEKTFSSVVLKLSEHQSLFTEVEKKNKKSTGRAFFYSLALPGAGQWYAGYGNESRIKAAGFALLEVTAWYLLFDFQARGKRFENKFENYANTHWDIDKYLSFLEEQLNLPPNYLGRKVTNNIDKSRLYTAETEWGRLTGVSTHHLFGSGMQQYYEMIYKYPEQFALGWSDATVPGPAQGQSPTGYTYQTLTPRMKYYRHLRNESNRYFRYSRNMTGVLLVNHVLSALDAAWTVKRKNMADQRIETGFRIQPLRQSGSYAALLQVHF